MPECCSSVVKLGAAGVGRVNVEVTGELIAVGSLGISASAAGACAGGSASETERLRRLLPSDGEAGLRIEKPKVPNTLRDTLRRPCVVADGDGGGAPSDTFWGNARSDSDASTLLREGRGGRPCFGRGLAHQDPIQSPKERSDLVLLRLGAFRLCLLLEWMLLVSA